MYRDFEVLQKYSDNMELVQIFSLLLMTGYLYNILFNLNFKMKIVSSFTFWISFELLIPIMILEYFIYMATKTTSDEFSNGSTIVTVMFRTIVHTSIVGGLIGTCREACRRYLPQV